MSMQEILTLLIPLIVLIGFIVLLAYQPSPQTYLLTVVYLLPLMAFKVATEEWGGFKVVDIISYITLVFLLAKFLYSPLSGVSKSNLIEILLLFAIVGLGLLNSGNSNTTLFKIMKMFPVFIFTRFLMIEFAIDPPFVQKILKAFRITFIFSLCFLVIQIAIGLNFTWYPSLNPNIADPANDFIRYPGIFYDPQLHGQFLAIGSFLILIPLGRSSKISLTTVGLFVLTAGAIALTGSRSALGGFTLGLAMILLLAGKKYLIPMLSLTVVLLVLYSTLFIDSPVFSRGGTVSSDLDYRQSIWDEAFDITKAHPLLGIGWGNYQTYIERNYQDQYLILDDEILYFDQPESGYLKIAVELGFPGLLIFLLLLLKPVVWGLKTFFSKRHDLSSLFLIAALVSWMFAFTTVYSFFDERILFVIALVIVLLHHSDAFTTTDHEENAYA